MLSQTFKIEITTTANESEALLLEANLIKKHKPKFNILLKDDKSFPFIFIGNKDKWSQIRRHRGKKTKEGFYFGPFASAGSANWTIKMIQKIFHLRVCDDTVFKNRKRPCILYQIKRCSGPCVGFVKEHDYKKSVEDAIEFVSGKSRKIQKSLSDQMEVASEELDFERAAILRDRIKSLNIIQSSQRINEANLIEADVIAAYKESGKTCVQVFFYRSKQNWGNQSYFPKHDPDEKLSDILNSFVIQFYENKSVPKSIILSEEIKEKELIEKTLTQKENKDINISVGKRGSKLKVITQAINNAKDSLNRKLYESQNNKNLFEEVCKKFDLDINDIYTDYVEYGNILNDYIIDTQVALYKEYKLNKTFLFEGAQGMTLDVDHGLYPHTTSSNTIAGQVNVGTGIEFNDKKRIIGVAKCYVSRVGVSPFPTEINGEESDFLRQKGKEFGTTTGRPRRVGHLDLVQLKQAVRVNGFTEIAFTKLDILSGIKEIKICDSYQILGKKYDETPGSLGKIRLAKPNYISMEGWESMDQASIEKISKKGFDFLPNALKEYIYFIEDKINCPIKIISIGPQRHQTILR